MWRREDSNLRILAVPCMDKLTSLLLLQENRRSGNTASSKSSSSSQLNNYFESLRSNVISSIAAASCMANAAATGGDVFGSGANSLQPPTATSATASGAMMHQPINSVSAPGWDSMPFWFK